MTMVERSGDYPKERPRPLGGIPEAVPDFDLAIEAAVLTDIERAKQGLGSGRDVPQWSDLKTKERNIDELSKASH